MWAYGSCSGRGEPFPQCLLPLFLQLWSSSRSALHSLKLVPALPHLLPHSSPSPAPFADSVVQLVASLWKAKLNTVPCGPTT